jgi:hypothetical protein
MSDPVRINGNLYSWSSVEFHVGDERITGVTAVEYSDNRERTSAYGMNRAHAPIGQSAGKYATDPVKATLWKHTANALRKALAQLAGTGGFGNVEFTIVVQYTENDLGSVVDTIRRCTWGKQTSKAEENPEPLKEDVEFKCLSILWNGETLFDSTDEL